MVYQLIYFWLSRACGQGHRKVPTYIIYILYIYFNHNAVYYISTIHTNIVYNTYYIIVIGMQFVYYTVVLVYALPRTELCARNIISIIL